MYLLNISVVFFQGSLPDLEVYQSDLANIKQSGLKLCTMLGENGFSHQIRKELQTLESLLTK